MTNENDQTPILVSSAFTVIAQTNKRRCRCLYCKNEIAPRDGHYMFSISVKHHGYLCPSCLATEIETEKIRPARAALLDEIKTELKKDQRMGWCSYDKISTLVYHAGVAGVTVARYFLDKIKELENVNYHETMGIIRTYKSQGIAPDFCLAD